MSPVQDNPLPDEFVLSRPLGMARAPKDFDWLKKNIPCQAACPAGTDIPAYLDAIANRDTAQAYLINLQDNVFPAVLGRVCTRPCEPVCRHGWEGLGEPVAICFSKRSAGDFLKRKEPVVLDPIFPPTGKRIAVVGGGVAGLAAARELALWGHMPVVFEKYPKPGGMMVQGIPPFRLPRDVVELEIDQVVRLGVEIRCNAEIGRDVTLSDLMNEYDAVIMAAGTHKPYIPDLPGVDLDGVRHGLGFLQEVNEQHRGDVGARVVVIGGGFTAVDCARTAQRLGAESVKTYYRRSESEMYITGHEIEEMRKEGILFETMTAPVAIMGEGGRVTGVRFSPTMLGEPDATGRRRPVPIPESEFEVQADTVLLGTGQVQDTSWIDRMIADALMEDGRLKTGSAQTTAVDKLFVAGDFALGAISLIDAIGHAKTCARKVDTYLMGEERLSEVAMIEDARSTGRTRAMDQIPRQPMPTLPREDRGVTDEVETGFDQDTAATEASRCYLCHYKYEIDNDLCIYCDRCLKVKPVEKCIVKVSALKYDDDGRITGYEPSTSSRDYNMLFIDQNECIRCGACADVCPVECIPLQKVSLKTVKTAEVTP